MIDDCFFHDKHRLRHEDAIEILKSRLVPIAAKTTIGLAGACGRILAKPVLSARNIPAFTNSAVDGYAFCRDDNLLGADLNISIRIAAGDKSEMHLEPGDAARIFTGAKLPIGADTVAMQEDCKPITNKSLNQVRIPAQLKKGANVRLAGEDVKTGETIAGSERPLRPQDIAAIASAGHAKVEIYKPLRIALASTGSEIVRPGEALEESQVYDANHFMITSLLSALPVEVTDIGILPDDREQVETTLTQATKDHDIVITSGGASMGDEDHVTNLLAKKGTRHMWQLAIKPGRPMCFGQLNEAMFFGLPGNPVAGFICFLLYVRPSILRLGGAQWHEPRRYQLPSGITFKNKKPDRREYWRGYIDRDNNGTSYLKKFERDGSGLISGLQKAEGLIEISEETTQIFPGEMLNFIPFTEFGIT